MIPKQQTSKDKTWIDGKGTPIPYSRITKAERIMERHAHTILTQAQKVNDALVELKALVGTKHNDVLAAVQAAEGVDLKSTKGNKKWYSFDRSVMVECNMQDNIHFDDLLIGAAREKLNTYLSTKLSSNEEFLVEMVTSAFETTNGKIDTKRIMHLLSFRRKIRSPLFQEALDTIEKSMKRTHSKTYFVVGVRQEDGSYKTVQLNFSAI